MTDRDTNRTTFPLTAAAVDLFTAAFGPVRVRYIEEGGRTMGKRSPEPSPPTIYSEGRKYADPTRK